MTQEQLAEKSNRHFTYIGRIERGEKNISVQALNDILNAMEISFQVFFQPFENPDFDPKDDLYNEIMLSLQQLNSIKQKKAARIIKIIIEEL